MRPPERVKTERLVLRIPSLADATAIFSAYAQDGAVLRYLAWRPHQNLQETEEFIALCLKAWEAETRFPYVITLQESGPAVGMIEIRINSFKADVGYVLSQTYWGKGIAPEALRSLVAWSLNQPAIYRVWALCDVDNEASARVLEKVGMQREGLLRRQMVHPNIGEEPRDCYCYAVVK